MILPFHYLPRSVESNAVWLTASLWSYYRCFLEHYGLRHFQIQLFLYSCSCLSRVFKLVGFGADGWALQNLSGFPFIPSFSVFFDFSFATSQSIRLALAVRTPRLSRTPRENKKLLSCAHAMHMRERNTSFMVLAGFYTYLKIFELDFSVTWPLNV